MKTFLKIILFLVILPFCSISQDKEFDSLDSKLIIPTFIKGAFQSSDKKSFQKVECYSNDTLGIVHDTTFYFKSGKDELALMVFYTVKEPIDNFSLFQTGVIYFSKNDKNKWKEEYNDMNVSSISKHEAPPSYRLLNLGDGDYGLLIYDDYSGGKGFNYYWCDLYSVLYKKVFSLNTLIDSSGGREGKTSVETKKSVFIQGKDLCIKTKGHIENFKKVDYTDFFHFNEDQSRYIQYKKINHIR
jgi:hypothetical protein